MPANRPVRRALRLRAPAVGETSWQVSRAPLDEETVRRLQLATRKVVAHRDADAGTHSVYVALLEGVPGDGPFSFYVGMTGLTPDERYLQHKAGEKAGRRRVTRYGIGLLPQLTNRFNPMAYDEARVVEMALLWRLCQAGFIAHGA